MSPLSHPGSLGSHPPATPRSGLRRIEFRRRARKGSGSLYSFPADWKQDNPTTQQIGARWVDDGSYAVLSVPSVVVSIARNYLLNPKHPGFRSILCSGTTVYSFDDRLLNPVPAGP